jgi:PadR family transcriptional regulator, regulatory protein PadR
MVRNRKPLSRTWRTFLENHAPQLISIDFFTVPKINPIDGAAITVLMIATTQYDLQLVPGRRQVFVAQRAAVDPVWPARDVGSCRSSRRAESISPCLPRAEVLASVTEDIKMSKPSDLVQGTLEMLLLKILALEPMNGFAVTQRLKQVSGDVLKVSDGSLYPALHKLEQEGWITAEWKTSENGRRAKYYSLTRLGRRQLAKEADNWGRLSSAISRVIKLKEA